MRRKERRKKAQFEDASTPYDDNERQKQNHWSDFVDEQAFTSEKNAPIFVQIKILL